MADISAAAAKEHILKGSGEIQRVSKDAIEAAREAGHRFLAEIGREAAERARAEGRKTLMESDVQAAAGRVLGAGAPSAGGGEPAA